MGEDYFNSQRDFDDLREPIVPPCFLFIFSSFIEIYNLCAEGITWKDIESYAILHKIDFTQFEISLLVKCSNWANEKISEMRKGE